ncbi:3-oxoadipyl-CoA thiolase [Photorhabdus bodei]|uniref:Beta-ketoadipyl-CoA thiolase n=1 Tax=Photorhabdus bodei TaxID=2029681 RepID=A0AAW6BJM2_9GAMM|nr:3-oxoadipyl-CoA thiolase [Photorhabdus bodei]MDB6372910.1 3-oxoadipyl-CoA thiolase [Photorhabdus bodei]
MIEAYICDAVRTPFGKYDGSLSQVRADDLAALTIQGLLTRHPQLESIYINDVILGCANQSGEDNRNVARMALLLAGLSEQVPGTTINRLCGSGLDAVAMAARTIKSGEADLIIAGGVESMTRAPYIMGKAHKSFARNMEIEDTTMGWRFINPRMKAIYGVHTMPETAENLAERYSISRQEQDKFALQSQLRTSLAQENGFFKDEIIPVILPGKASDTMIFSKDEHPRQTSLEALTTLRPIVKKEGTITAGNSSGINDGASALLIASKIACDKYQLKPLAKILVTATAGVHPEIMGIGPVPAVKKALAMSKAKIEDMDIIEINEAFAAQALAVMKEFNIRWDAPHVNCNGGAISLGHPLGASGGRILANAVYQLHRQQGKLALCTMCIGVGQGIAMIIERV